MEERKLYWLMRHDTKEMKTDWFLIVLWSVALFVVIMAVLVNLVV